MKALLSLSCSELSCENRQLSKLLDKEQIHWRKLRTKNCNEQSVTLKLMASPISAFFIIK